jgi:DnaJ family protein B protein 12
MEVNKDEAERCLDISKKKWREGSKETSFRFAKKSIALFKTDEAEAWLKIIQTATVTEETTTSSRRSSDSSTQDAPKSPQREFTQEQVEAVKSLKACGSELYKILGVSRDCSDADVKKAYRKVILFRCIVWWAWSLTFGF